MTLQSLTMNELERLYRKVWDRMVEGDGYQPFGYDWRTIRITHPGKAKILLNIRNEIASRK